MFQSHDEVQPYDPATIASRGLTPVRAQWLKWLLCPRWDARIEELAAGLKGSFDATFGLAQTAFISGLSLENVAAYPGPVTRELLLQVMRQETILVRETLVLVLLRLPGVWPGTLV